MTFKFKKTVHSTCSATVWRCIVCAAVAMAIALGGHGTAMAQNAGETDQNKVHRLGEVRVHGRDDQPGEQTLNQDFLRMVPSQSGTVPDAFRSRSDIQYDIASRNGSTGGDITPPKISVRGAQFYENNFMLNGMGMNNYITPEGFSNSPGFPNAVAGDPQTFFLDTSMLENVKVYTENVPARYGDFLGGVFDSSLRKARSDRWHASAGYRYSPYKWAKQHKYGDEADNAYYQKDFALHDVNVSLDGPVYGGLGVMLAYNQKYSTFELDDSLTPSTNHGMFRRNQNFLLRLNTPEEEAFTAAFTAIYAPYVQKGILASSKDSNFELRGGGMTLMLETEAKTGVGKWENSVSWGHTEVTRDNDGKDTVYQWRTTPNGTANWNPTSTTSWEGIMAGTEQVQEVLAFRSHMDFNKVTTGPLAHLVNAGLQIENIHATTDKDRMRVMTMGQPAPNVIGAREDGIIAGEQFLSRVSIRPQREHSVNLNKLAAYLEDEMEISRLTLRLGARLGYDDITDNLTFAPRLFANLDVLGDKRLNVYGGYNRYYGNQIIARAIAGYTGGPPAIGQTYTRKLNPDGSVGDWTLSNPGSLYGNTLSGLKTPYSDEFNAGIGWRLWDVNFNLIGVLRNHRDQIRTMGGTNAGPIYYSNSGESDYWGVTFSIDRDFDLGSFGMHNAALSITRSDVKSNNMDNNFSSGISDGYDPDHIYLDGSVTSKSDMSARNFNAPWVISYRHQAAFWEDRLRLMGIIRYEKGYDGLRYTTPNTYTDPDSGLIMYSYKRTHLPDSVNVDLSVEVDAIRYDDHVLTFIAEITNLMDRKNQVNTDTSAASTASYAMGRRLYLGLRYTF